MATREYRGLAYRNNADLAAWLAKRPAEKALEPDLPIIDPHHHLGVPEVMVRIDDRQVGFQRLLRGPLGEPSGEIRVVAIGETAVFACCHVFPPGLWPTIAQEG